MGEERASLSGGRSRTVLARRYELLALLGVGGMGSVYRAHDLELDEDVALKVLRRELAGSPGVLERFKREVKLARRVTHPNVARTFDIGEHDGERFLTMELVEGESLGELLGRDGRLSIDRTIEIAVAVCHGLSAAHAAGVVHRDLKPDNVLLGREGRIMITDFGIARAFATGGALRTQGVALGTPEYMAPEQIEASDDVDHRADVYALGVMLYEMLVGERPWSGDSAFGIAAARLIRPPPDPREKAEIPDALARAILRCLARHPKDRFATAADVGAALAGMTLPAGLARPRAPSIRPPAAPRKVTLTIAPFAPTSLFELVRSELARIPQLVVSGWPGEGNVVLRATAADGVVSITLSNAEDHFVLTQCSARLDDPFGAARRIVTEVARALSTRTPAPIAPPPPSPIATELLLSARAECDEPGSQPLDRAIARLERAIGLLPDDPWIHGAYAWALARRFCEGETPREDADEARSLAMRALARAPLMVDALAALAFLDHEEGRPIEAARRVRAALALDTSRAALHHLHGRLLADLDDPEAATTLRTATTLDVRRVAARWDEALVRAVQGDLDTADHLLRAREPAEEQASGLWFSRLRVGLLTGELSRVLAVADEAQRRFFERRELFFAIASAARRGRASPEVLSQLHGRTIAAEPAARRARHHVLEAELLAFVGDMHGAVRAVRAAVDAGCTDLGWIERAPILEPLRTRSPFLSARDDARIRAVHLRAALQDLPQTLDAIPHREAKDRR